MQKEEAKEILECYLNCPCRWEGECPHEDEYCENGCWSRELLETAIRVLIN